MSEVLVKFDEPIGDSRGALYFAQATGRQREDGLWEGWIEFVPVDESAPARLSGRETTQPNRVDVDYWAQGLTKVYLEGALVRAKLSTAPIQRDQASRQSSRETSLPSSGDSAPRD